MKKSPPLAPLSLLLVARDLKPHCDFRMKSAQLAGFHKLLTSSAGSIEKRSCEIHKMERFTCQCPCDVTGKSPSPLPWLCDTLSRSSHSSLYHLIRTRRFHTGKGKERWTIGQRSGCDPKGKTDHYFLCFLTCMSLFMRMSVLFIYFLMFCVLWCFWHLKNLSGWGETAPPGAFDMQTNHPELDLLWSYQALHPRRQCLCLNYARARYQATREHPWAGSYN